MALVSFQVRNDITTREAGDADAHQAPEVLSDIADAITECGAAMDGDGDLYGVFLIACHIIAQLPEDDRFRSDIRTSDVIHAAREYMIERTQWSQYYDERNERKAANADHQS